MCASRALAAGVAIVLVAVLTPEIAQASVDSDDVLAPANTAASSDLEFIAAARNISVAEAEARISWQNDFAIAATTVEEKFPHSFASAEIVSEVPPVAAIRFTGEVPDGVEQLLSNVPDSVEVQIEGGATLSADGVDELVIAAHTAVSQSGQASDMVSFYVEATGLVMIEARPARHLSPDEISAATRGVVAGLPTWLRDSVSLTLSDTVRTGDDARYGGGRLEQVGKNSLECTAGFNVIDSSGVTGVATAGHCKNKLTHENESGATEYALALKQSHVGNWGDFQWHTSTDTEPDDFIYIQGSLQNVSGVANPTLGQALCRFGQKTLRQCDTVDNLSVCVTVNNIQACRLVRMSHDWAQGGDSGGPWYSGGTAYGFHKGSVSCGSSSCDLWSRATYIDDALGVTIRS